MGLLTNSKVSIVPRRKGLLKRVLLEQGIKYDKQELNSLIAQMHVRMFEKDQENMFEDLETYHKLHIYQHLAKASPASPKIFGFLDRLLSVKNVYKQILYHKSYSRYRSNLLYLMCSNPNEAREDK